MGQVNDASFTRILGESMVELADANLDAVCKHTDGDRDVIRLNLIAFCTFGLTWSAADRLNEDQIGVFTTAVLSGAAGKARTSSQTKLLEMFRSRHEGFLTALMNVGQDQMALTNYFQACCSVDRIEVHFSDIYPDPNALEEMGNTLGGLTDDGKAMIQKVKAMRDPAIYRMDTFRSLELFNILMGLMEHLKESLSRLGR